MSECPFCGTGVQEHVSVCRGCGAERVKGYVSQQTMKFLVVVGTILGIPTAFFVAFAAHSTPLMVVVLLAMMLGPVLFLKLKIKTRFPGLDPQLVNFDSIRENLMTHYSKTAISG